MTLLKNKKVKIIGNKIISLQDGSTPGVYKIFNVILGKKYKINFIGLNSGNTDKYKMWIGDKNMKTIYFGTILSEYIFKIENVLIGILFYNTIKNSFFYLNDISIITETLISIPRNISKNIFQIKTSDNIKYFDNYVKKKYNFLNYKNKNKPCIFYGCYNKNDLKTIKNHTGKKFLIWGGSDINKTDIFQKVRTIKNLTHISQSSFINDDLNRHKIKFIYIPFAPTVNYNSYVPIIKETCIYIYTNPLNEDFYGKKIYEKLIKIFSDIKFIFATNENANKIAKEKNLLKKDIKYYPPNELIKIYSQCFLALRLTNHDGVSATVQELGLLGIKTVHNGITPSCLKYNNIEDVIKHINNEKKYIGTKDIVLSNEVKTYLQKGDKQILNL